MPTVDVRGNRSRIFVRDVVDLEEHHIDVEIPPPQSIVQSGEDEDCDDGSSSENSATSGEEDSIISSDSGTSNKDNSISSDSGISSTNSDKDSEEASRVSVTIAAPPADLAHGLHAACEEHGPSQKEEQCEHRFWFSGIHRPRVIHDPNTSINVPLGLRGRDAASGRPDANNSSSVF
ncbi:hypothetical protein F5884DRAFT_862554 [Xylogone sp. PMI_703]|nr:hypothetical protein F5884DRAFT_862554 [Xylogone sp. PMI_703]